MDAWLEKGRAAWPDVPLDPKAFAAHVAALGASADVARAPELYLCCACGAGVPAALAAFEARYGSVIHSALAALGLAPSVREDVAQQVRTRLFVAQAGSRPKVLEYSGKGDLAGWVRVLATRVGLRTLRDRRRQPEAAVSDDEKLLDNAGPAPDPELRALENRFGPPLKAAFLDALKGLEPKQQNLLRQRFLDGLGWDELATLHGVHRATVVRWLAAARHELLSKTQDLLVERTGMARAECLSLIRAVQPDVSVTLRRILT